MIMATESVESLRIIKLPEVLSLTGLSRASIYEKMNLGSFPRTVKLGGRSVGWYEREIAEWLGSRPRTK